MELDGEGAANFEQLQDLILKECDKRDRKYARLVTNVTSWNNKLNKRTIKKHATEGPISKPQRTRRLEEKQIKPKARYEPTKDSPKKRPYQPLWPKKTMKPRKPRTSRRKKQRFQDKNRKQTNIALAKQIKSESEQQRWQEKTAKEATTK